MIDIDPTMPLPPPGRVPAEFVQGTVREALYPMPVHFRDGDLTWRPSAVTVAPRGEE